jgi:hypothetical protein
VSDGTAAAPNAPYVIDPPVRLTRGVVAAGVNVLRAEVDINGRIVVVAGKASDDVPGDTPEVVKNLI